MGFYSKKGLYSAYDKNHKEREALDYYATPTKEVENILKTLNLDFENATILEPCVGGGHMAQGIFPFLKGNTKLFCSDIKNRGWEQKENQNLYIQYNLDFLSDDYPFNKIDYVIMNPPFKLIEPFVIRGLEISQKGMLMLGRLQFLEGKSRFEKIFDSMPPTDVYVYVDRISCFKNGDFSIKPDGIQAYAWFYWDKEKDSNLSNLHWIRRV